MNTRLLGCTAIALALSSPALAQSSKCPAGQFLDATGSYPPGACGTPSVTPANIPMPNGTILIGNSGGVGQTYALGSGVQAAVQNAVNATNGLLTYSLIGTSGTALGLLNANKTDSGNNTYSGSNVFGTPASINLSNATVGNGIITGHVASLTALEAAATTTYPLGVWRDTYGNNNGALPLFYTPSASACSLYSGSGDGGSQVKSADSECWIASLDPEAIDVSEFGVAFNNSSPGYTHIQDALNYAALLAGGGTVVVPSKPSALGGVVCLGGPLTVTNSKLKVDGTIAACNYNAANLITATGFKTVIEGYGSILGKGGWTSGGETVGAAFNTLVFSSCVQCTVKQVSLTGGIYTIANSGGDTVIDDAHVSADYGAGYYGNADATWMMRFQDDNHEWPYTEPSYPLTILARTNGMTVTPGQVISIVQGGVTYILQVMSGTLTGTSAPTVLPYSANINDIAGGGSANAVEQLQSVNVSYAMEFTTGAEEVYADHVDMSSGNSSGIHLDNAGAGTAPHTISFTHSIISQNRGTMLDLAAGSNFSFDHGELSGCLIASCILAATGVSWTGGLDLHDQLIFGNGGSGFVDQQGSGYNTVHNNPNVGPFSVNGIVVDENNDHIDDNIFTASTTGNPMYFQNTPTAVTVGTFLGNDCTAAGSGLSNSSSISTTVPSSGGSSINALPISGNTRC